MTSRFLPLALLLAAGLAPAAHARLVANLQAPFTVALKLTTTGSSQERDVSGGRELTAKFQTVRLTARDVLAGLIEDGEIAGPLAGWRLVGRCDSDTALGVNRRVFAVKAGQPDYALDGEETSVLAFNATFSTASYRTRTRDGAITAGTSTVKLFLEGVFQPESTPLILAGTGDLTYSYKPAELGEVRELVTVPSSIKLAAIGGATMPNPDNQEIDTFIIEGAIALGRHKITAVRNEPPAS